MKTNTTSHYINLSLIALALSFQCLLHISAARQTSENTKPQIACAKKEIAIIVENHEKLSKLIECLKIPVMITEYEQKRFTDLMKEVSDLARRGDEDARWMGL